MGKILDWMKNEEHLKIAIMDYLRGELDIINISEEYWLKHREIFKKNKEPISRREFNETLYNYLWLQKVSELLIIIYLEDLKGLNPTIYQANKLLRRTKDQYGATFKSVKKLQDLDILYTKTVKDSNRKEKQIFINKDIVKIYGDDEFRRMMLCEWDSDAKKYVKLKLKLLLEEKNQFEDRIKMIKKGKRVKK